MKRFVLFTPLFWAPLISFTQINFIQNLTNISSSFGSSVGVSGNAIDTLSSTNFVLAANFYDSLSSGVYLNKGVVLKSNFSGNITWLKEYSSYKDLRIEDVASNSNKEITMVGTVGYGSGSGFIVLIKCDSNGSLIWSKKITSLDRALKLHRLKAGGYIAAASKYMSNSLSVIFKFDELGQIIWCRYISNASNNIYFRSFHQNANSNIAITGILTDYSIGKSKGCIIVLDTNGNLKNDLIMTDLNNTSAYPGFHSVTTDSKGNYIFSGFAFYSNVNSACGPFYMKTDSSLVVKWSTLYNDTNTCCESFATSVMSNGNLISVLEPEGHSSVSFVKRTGICILDSAGNFIKSYLVTADSTDHFPDRAIFMEPLKIFFAGTKNGSTFYSCVDTTTNGFCGFQNIALLSRTPNVNFSSFITLSNMPFQIDTVLISSQICTKVIVGNDCDSQIGIANLNRNESIKIFPNPAKSLIYLQSPYELNAIIIYNSIGRTAFQIKSKNTQEQIDVSGLPSGIYLIHTASGYSKFIKE